MSTASTSYTFLASRPESPYRQLFVKATHIRAEVLYRQSIGPEPLSPEQIAENYSLPVEAVREAIAYCESNPPEIEEDRQREELLAEHSGINAPDYKQRGKPKLLSAQDLARMHK